jgi:hypothetical protein
MNREDVVRLAKEAGLSLIYDERDEDGWQELERFAALVAANEREECAKWADLVAREMDNTNNTATYIASGIRARGEK